MAAHYFPGSTISKRYTTLRDATGGKYKDGTPKNHKRRTVPFPSSLVPELRELTKNKAPGDRVFQSDRGKMTLDTYADLFDSDLDRVGTEIDSLIRKHAA